MPRKITQITCDNDRLVVLCGDSTIWMLDMVNMPRPIKWERLPEIPDKNDKSDEDEEDEG